MIPIRRGSDDNGDQEEEWKDSKLNQRNEVEGPMDEIV